MKICWYSSEFVKPYKVHFLLWIVEYNTVQVEFQSRLKNVFVSIKHFLKFTQAKNFPSLSFISLCLASLNFSLKPLRGVA
jgi:hypothetical protein